MSEIWAETAAPLIVGSGASGTAAALQLVRLGLRPVVLDVGQVNRTPDLKVEGNLYDFRKQHDTFDLFIGKDYRGVSHVMEGKVVVAKLNAPNAAFVTADAQHLSPVDAMNFDPIQSFALGGLGNVWGAGLYRFVADDLRSFPIREADLAPFFDLLTGEIGISGIDDDLTAFFGETRGLLSPLRLSYNASRFYDSYTRRRAAFRLAGIYVGRPRLGVLSQSMADRPACDYSNREFWLDTPYLYTPAVTLRRLRGAGQIDYRPGILVRSWSETAEGVVVDGTELATGNAVRFVGRSLFLAAGAIGTSKIVLESHQDYATTLSLLENPAVQIPFVLPASIGRALDTHAFGLTQLNLVWQSSQGHLQGSLLELTGPMRAEFFARLPLSARANLVLVRTMLPAILLLQLFYPGDAQPHAQLSLRKDGRLCIIGCPNTIDTNHLRPLLKILRATGLWTLPSLINKVPTGHAIHYAGTLPMRESPGRYECNAAGRLSGTRRVYIVDSACFSSLPAKNMSLGMMANAMRIADSAVREMRS